MNPPHSSSTASPKIDRLIDTVRVRIRRLVVLESTARVLIGVIGLFWIELALDYLPVWFGHRELSQPVRAVWLVVTIGVAGWLLFRDLFQRLRVPLPARSLALLIERRYPEFGDRLVTLVEADPQRAGDATMWHRIQAETERRLEGVSTAKIVPGHPIRRWLMVALLAMASVIGLAWYQPGVARLAASRFYSLSQANWPRRTRLELVGLRVRRDDPIEGIPELNRWLRPDSKGRVRVARGSSLTAEIRAEHAPDHPYRRVPETCWMHFQFPDRAGSWESRPFQRIGQPRDGFQTFRFEDKAMDGLIERVAFEVTGGDARMGPFQIEVVDPPVIEQTLLNVTFPEYLSKSQPLRFAPREIRWTGNVSLPAGSQVTLHSRSNRPLSRVHVRSGDGSMQQLETRQASFQLALDPLSGPVIRECFPVDVNQIVPEIPYVVRIDTIFDQPPEVQSRVLGLGTAITPDAKLTIAGSITDDYGTEASWLETVLPGELPVTVPVELDREGNFQTSIDFRERRSTAPNEFKLQPGTNQTVTVSVHARDRRDLEGGANLGRSPRIELDVVSQDELLRRLELAEVGQRQRLEQVYRELSDVPIYLQRTSESPTRSSPGMAEPGDRGRDDAQPAHADGSVRRLFAQRILLQIDKSSREISGSAEAFENLRQQLVNNRVTGTGRDDRFANQVSQPLAKLASGPLAELREVVAKLESLLRARESVGDEELSAGDEPGTDDSTPIPTDELPQELIQRANEGARTVLVELEAVINRLLKYETQNELLDIVRRMIEDQQELLDRTRQLRQERAFEGLLDNF